jgi:hypothetical protein
MMEAWGVRRGGKVRRRGSIEVRMVEASAGGVGVGA